MFKFIVYADDMHTILVSDRNSFNINPDGVEDSLDCTINRELYI